MASARASGGVAKMLDAAVAAPGGEVLVRELARSASEERAVVLGAVLTTASASQRNMLTARVEEANKLRQTKTEISTDARLRAHRHADALWQANENVRDELIATGAKSREWVDEHIVLSPRPVLPIT